MRVTWHDRRSGSRIEVDKVGELHLSGIRRFRIRFASGSERIVLASDCTFAGLRVNGKGRGLDGQMLDKARKVKALKDRGSTEGERSAAGDRLVSIAAKLGLTVEQLEATL